MLLQLFYYHSLFKLIHVLLLVANLIKVVLSKFNVGYWLETICSGQQRHH
jgi:hypothetical protein